MKILHKTKTAIIVAVGLLFSFNSQAADDFDQHKPSDMSSEKWSSLKAVVQDAGILGSQENEGFFGVSIDINGDFAAVGSRDFANGVNAGAVYLYELQGGQGGGWIQTAKLTANDGQKGDLFGASVSLSGNRLLVGASFNDDNGSNTGSAYIFELFNNQWQQTTKLIGSNSDQSDFFGTSVSLDGDTAVVGARLATNGVVQNSGAVYVFDGTNNWSETILIPSNDGVNNDAFGQSVAVLGDRIVVGAAAEDNASGSDAGAVYVFDWNGSTWNENKVTPNDAHMGQYFGSAVSLDTNRMLIGAHSDNENGINAGAAYIFDFNGTSWQQHSKLLASDSAVSDRYGLSVSLKGNKAVVGSSKLALNSTNSVGAAYAYQFVNGIWNEVNTYTGGNGDLLGRAVGIDNSSLFIAANTNDHNKGTVEIYTASTASEWAFFDTVAQDNTTAGDEFGSAVGIWNNYAIIGAHKDEENGVGAGAAYIFRFNGNHWEIQKKLLAGDGAPGDRFGHSVSIHGSRAVVGAYKNDLRGPSPLFLPLPDAGSAYVFENIDGIWQQVQQLKPTDGPVINDEFGRAVSLEGNRIVVGAAKDDTAATDAGAVYVYRYNEIISTWVLSRKFTADNPSAGDGFGYALSLSDEQVLIGAPFDATDDINAGAAYIFKPSTVSANHWLQVDKLLMSDQPNTGGDLTGALFGSAVSLDSERALIGAYSYSLGLAGNIGRAYIFEKTTFAGAEEDWQFVHRLRGALSGKDNFGYSVSLSGNLAIIGAWRDEPENTFHLENYGSAFVFTYDGFGWNSEIITAPLDGQNTEDFFGVAVAVAGDKILIGAHRMDYDNNDPEDNSGAVISFIDAATANNDNFTVTQDAAATVLNVRDNDIGNANNTTFEVKSIDTAPSHGTATIGGLGGFGAHIIYTPDAFYCNNTAVPDPDILTYSLTGGSSATVAITVTCTGLSDLIFADGFE